MATFLDELSRLSPMAFCFDQRLKLLVLGSEPDELTGDNQVFGFSVAETQFSLLCQSSSY